MTRLFALLLAVFASVPVTAPAQTQGTLKAGDALMQCLQASGEVRPVQRAADLAHSVSSADNFGWVPSEVAAGTWRLERKDAGFGLSMEIRLVSPDGSAHCLVFGPALGAGDADAAADRLAQSGRLGTVSAAEPGQGATRRYVVGGLPYSAELVSYSVGGTGPVVGMVFAGVAPQSVSVLAGSQGSSGGANLVATAVRLCNVPGMQDLARVNAFLQAGFSGQVDRSTVNSDTTHTFTSPDRTVMVEFYYGEMPEYCTVNAFNMGVTEAAAVLDQVVPQLYPGFSRRVLPAGVDPSTGRAPVCVVYEDPTNPIGLAIGVIPGETDTEGCFDNGSSHFYSSSRV